MLHFYINKLEIVLPLGGTILLQETS